MKTVNLNKSELLEVNGGGPYCTVHQIVSRFKEAFESIPDAFDTLVDNIKGIF